jgi:hypothetical protein
MGSEQNYQVDRDDSESEDQVKKLRKNRSKAPAPKPREQGGEVNAKKPEIIKIPTNSGKSSAAERAGHGILLEEITDLQVEYRHGREGQTVVIDLNDVGLEQEIPLVPWRQVRKTQQPDFRREEIIAIPDFDQEYKESVSATADSFEDMVSEVLASGPINELEAAQSTELDAAQESRRSYAEQAVSTATARQVASSTFNQLSSLHDRPHRDQPTAKTSPIVAANRAQITSASTERLDGLSADLSNILSTPETPADSINQSADRFSPPEVVGDDQTENELPPGHRIEHSVWHSIEVDSRTGHAVEKPTFAYGHEFNREQAPEHKEQSDEEIAVASGQLGVGGSTNIDMQSSSPLSFSQSLGPDRFAPDQSSSFSKLSHIELPANLPPGFMTDVWLWILLGVIVTVDLIAIFG